MFVLRHYYGLSFISTAISYIILQKVFKKGVGYLFEQKADNFAINNASVDELKGALRLFQAEKEVSIIAKLPFLNYLLSTHSTPSSRKKALRAALEKDEIQYTPTLEEIQPLIELLKENEENSLISKFLKAESEQN